MNLLLLSTYCILLPTIVNISATNDTSTDSIDLLVETQLPKEELQQQQQQHSRQQINRNSQRNQLLNAKKKLIVSTVLEEPYMMLKQNSQFLTGNDRFEGYLADLMYKLATKLNENYELRLSQDGLYGHLNDEGTWTGSIGEVLTETSDIALGPLIIDDLKLQYVDFTEPFLTLRSSGLVRRNSPPPKPKITPKERKQQNTSLSTEQQTQSNDIIPQRDEVQNVIPTTGNKLLMNRNYTIGFLRNGPAQKWLSTAVDPVLRQAWTRASSAWPSGVVESIQEGVERTRREQFAFIVDSATAEYVAGKKPCDLVATEPFLEPVKYALIIRKTDERLRRNLDKYLREMRDNSELQNLFLKWWKDECKKFNTVHATIGYDAKQQHYKRQQIQQQTKQRHQLGFHNSNFAFDHMFSNNLNSAASCFGINLTIIILVTRCIAMNVICCT